LKRLYKVRLENRGVVVLAGGGAFVTSLVNIWIRLYPRARNEAAVAASVEEARALIRQRQAERAGRAEQPSQRL
jgi:hypothetical protein